MDIQPERQTMDWGAPEVPDGFLQISAHSLSCAICGASVVGAPQAMQLHRDWHASKAPAPAT